MKNKKLFYGVLLIVIAIALLITVSLSLRQEKQPLTIEQVEQVQEKYASELMAIDGVTAVAIGECEGKPCIKVFLENDFPDLKERVPKQLDRVKVETQVSGPFKAL